MWVVITQRLKITQQTMPLKYMKYFECIGSGKGKISGLCTKSYSSQEVEAMQLLDIKLAEVTYAQKKQRVEDQSDPPLDPGTSVQAAPASQQSGSQQPRTPARTSTHAHLSACAKATHPFWLSAFAKAAHPS